MAKTKNKNRGTIKRPDVISNADDATPTTTLTKRKRAEGDDAESGSATDAGTDDDWRSKAVTKLSQFPRNMVKYWHARYRLVSQYDSGILLDLESWYSITPESIAHRIAARCSPHPNTLVLDVFAGCGGNSIQFALAGCRVIAIDIDPVKVEMARHNARVYGVEDRIEFKVADGVQFLRDHEVDKQHIDVVFLSPPWGGVEYREAPLIKKGFNYYPLDKLAPVSGKELYTLSRRITPNVAMYLPRTCDLEELSALAEGEEMVDVEEQWMGDSFKALSVYFGKELVQDWKEPIA